MSRLSSRHCLAILALLLPAGALADVYKFVDRSGHVYYTDKPSHSGFRMIIETPEPFTNPVRVTFGAGRNGRNLSLNGFGGMPRRTRSAAAERNRGQYASVIADAAYRHGLDPALLHAVIQAESAYNPGAVSHKGAMGMMQLMPGTAARYGVRNPFDPIDNIGGGARYLADLMDMFRSDITLAVAAYNAGEQNVIKYGNRVPPFPETRNYVSKVLANYNR